MAKAFESATLLSVRGTCVPDTLEAMRNLHNSTAGSEQGIAAARSLGDLSHNVFAPCLRTKSGARAGELLFIDWWDRAEGIMKFFSNPQAQQLAGQLFSERDPTLWMPARGSSSYALPAPKAKTERYVGMIRGAIRSAEQALETFAKVDVKAQRDARRRGLVSHQLFIRVSTDDSSAAELLGLDLWSDFAGMNEHYSDTAHTSGLGGAFAGPPESSIWEQPAGDWSEW